MNGKHHMGMSLIDMNIQDQRNQNILNYHNKVRLDEQSNKDRNIPRNITHLQHMIMQNIVKSCNEKA